MTVERTLRLIAGSFILLSLALGHYVNQYWYLFTAFVGLNLFQSGFTNWCPMMTFLRKLEVGRWEGCEHAQLGLGSGFSCRLHNLDAIAAPQPSYTSLTHQFPSLPVL